MEEITRKVNEMHVKNRQLKSQQFNYKRGII